MDDTLVQWDVIHKRYDELSDQLSSSSLDTSKRPALQKELSYLSTLLAKHKEVDRLQHEHETLSAHAQESNEPGVAELYSEELEVVNRALVHEKQALDKILFPPRSS